MTQIVLHYHPDPFQGPCGLCNRPVCLEEGLQLIQADKRRPVCAACGRQAAPALTALLGVAEAAQRVGKIGQHTLSPPLSALLDLARAAEAYTAATGRTGHASAAG
jgi:hypothetical protein